MMKSHQITGGGGIQLHLVETGNFRGRPILFIHGFSQSCLAWTRQMNSDLADNYRLVAMDMRGHGLSDKPREGYTDSKLWGDDVAAAMQALSLDHPILTRVEESLRSVESLLRLCCAQELSAEDLYLMLGYNMSVPPYVRQALFSRSFDNDDLLPKIRKPVLIMHGADDAVVQPAAVDQHRAGIAHAQVHMMAKAGHAPFWDDAATFNQRLRAFCESL